MMINRFARGFLALVIVGILAWVGAATIHIPEASAANTNTDFWECILDNLGDAHIQESLTWLGQACTALHGAP